MTPLPNRYVRRIEESPWFWGLCAVAFGTAYLWRVIRWLS